MDIPEVANSKILVVDDAPEVRILVRGVLESENLQVVTVETGAQALECLAKGSIDLVLLDLELPDIQGTTLCRRLRETGVTLPIVMLTSRNQSHQRVAGLECGADDYIGKPFAPEELVARIRGQLRREWGFRSRVQGLLQQQWQQIHDGVRLAQRLQQPLQQEARTGSFTSSVRHIPVGRIGGDFFLLEAIDDSRTAVVIADAMGKGLGASLVMSWTLSQTYSLLHQGLGPVEVMTRLNQQLGPELSRLGTFVALFVGVYDTLQGEFRYVSGGTEPAIWLRKNVQGRRHKRLTTGGLPIGVESSFPYESASIFPQMGDELFLFTDGLNDSLPMEEQPALIRSLYRILLAPRTKGLNATLEDLMDNLRRRARERLTLRDDLTCLLVEFTPQGPGGISHEYRNQARPQPGHLGAKSEES